ncbi:PREDICTED: translocating chain-associated membrane protein 1, partial [Nicrophorus vespilloides]|uniref:Translocating chain-associated membrane protein 1 n=1 Tax=Nicrophorus vespilloides TaxID=110193 RepID=A0ABM1NGR8_NICVS
CNICFQSTTPIASVFIALQHNVTEAGEIPLYTSGIRDWAGIFFYSLICIVIHAIIQEYVIDKISKRLHLSKSKLAVFNTSGQLAIFYLISTVWGYDIIIREKMFPNISTIWTDYPSPMSFMMKLFLIIQIAYSLHEIPELYFQRTKKEEYVGKAAQSLAALVIIAIPYFLNFNRLLVCLLVQHFSSELMIHIAQLVQTVDKDEKFSKITRTLSNCVMILSRIVSIVIAVLSLWFGFAQMEQRDLDVSTGYFNTPIIRLAMLGAILVLQIYLTAVVIGKELEKVREARAFNTVQKVKPQKKEKPKKAKKVVEESDLPEVDQNTNKNLRNRSAPAAAKAK